MKNRYDWWTRFICSRVSVRRVTEATYNTRVALRIAKQLHFAHYRNQNLSPMWRAPVFKEKNALPRSELHFPIDNRYCLARAGQRHPDVRGHVIAALRPVRKIIGIFGYEPIEKLFQVAARSRIGILHYDDTATGVLDEHSHCPVPYSAP